jgi:hypothetical protein
MKNKLIFVFILALSISACNGSGENVVSGKNPPLIAVFKAEPDNIDPGDSSVLSWSVTDANVVELSGVGQVGQTDSRLLFPDATANYVLNATNIDGTTTKSLIITVKKKAKIIQIEELKEIRNNFCYLVTTFKNIGADIGSRLNVIVYLYDAAGDPLDTTRNEYFENIDPGETIQLGFTFISLYDWEKVAKIAYQIHYNSVGKI